MEIIPATNNEIAIFKNAAAKRYTELGISPADGSVLFDNIMNKIAIDIGITDAPIDAAGKRDETKTAACASKKTVKKSVIKKKAVMNKRAERVEKIASFIAEALELGRKKS